MKNKKQKAVLALATANIIWGLNNPLIKISLRFIPILLLISLKYVFGGVILTIFSYKKWRPIAKKYWPRIIIATLCGYILTTLLAYEGLKRTGGINTSLIYLISPLLLYILSMKVLKEKFNSKLLFGLVVGFLGALLIVVSPLIIGNQGAEGNVIGNLLVLLAVLADVIGSIIIKPVLRKVPPLQMTALRFIIGAAILLPFTLTRFPSLLHLTVSSSGAIALAYNLIFATVLGYYLFHYGFSKISGEQTSLLYYLDPVAGVVASIFILGENLTTLMIGGSLLVIWGLYAGEVKNQPIHNLISHHR
jgi:drug/metabolite transporter (DMT)-like permease